MSVDDVRSVAGSLGVDISELVDVDHEDDNTTDAMLDTEPSPSDIRIDDLFDTAPFADLVEPLPRPERRRLPRARTSLEQSFADAWAPLEDVVRAAEQLVEAGAEDDIGALVVTLEQELDALRTAPDFERAVEHHAEALAAFADAADSARNSSWQSRGAD